MNLITDGLPAMALGIDPAEKNIMDRKATKKERAHTECQAACYGRMAGLYHDPGGAFCIFCRTYHI